MTDTRGFSISVVIPCYKVKRKIMDVIAGIGPEVSNIYVIDDKCPEETGAFVEAQCTDSRVRVIFHSVNQGVGGATISGYRRALNDDADLAVKIDGDGQMDSTLIPKFVAPITEGRADYTKGNRFFHLEGVRQMPMVRLFGNAVLSFLTKFSTGYWNVFDPTNGFTAIHAAVLRELPLDRLSRRYFFESDMLFRLNVIGGVVVDVPMHARYGDEESQIRIWKVVGEFSLRHAVNFCKRIFYNYYLRNFNIASIEIILGACSLLFGTIYGTYHWVLGSITGTVATSGTVMVAALPVIIGVQLLLAFLAYDIQSVSKTPLHPML